MEVDLSAVKCDEEVDWFKNIQKRNNNLDDKEKVEMGKILVKSQVDDQVVFNFDKIFS